MALPCPGFEGSEKRLEVDFCFGSGSLPNGLRTLSRRQLDGLLEKVPARLMQAGADGDMSESMLCAFFYPHRWRSGAAQGCVAWRLAAVSVLQTRIY